MGQLGQFITNHWELWLALVVVLLFIFINELLSQKKRAKELSPAAVIEMMNHENAIVIDLRDSATFRAGHIIDAKLATADDFKQQRVCSVVIQASEFGDVACGAVDQLQIARHHPHHVITHHPSQSHHRARRKRIHHQFHRQARHAAK